MAIFNPQGQDVEPKEFTRASRGISPPQFTSGAAEGLKGGANFIEASVKAVDDVIKSLATEETKGIVYKERDELQAALTAGQKYAAAGGGIQVPAGAQAAPTNSPTDILPQQTAPAELPADIKNLPRTLGALVGAGRAGKLSETDMYGRIDAKLSDVRSRYPVGYRDTIDKTASHILGVDPANAYIQGVIKQINEGNAEANRTKHEVQASFKSLIDAGFDVSQPAAAHRAGLWSDEKAQSYIANMNIHKAKRDVAEANAKAAAAAGELDTNVSTRLFNADAVAIIAPYTGWLEKQYETLPKDENGNVKYDGPQATMAAQLANSKMQEYRASLNKLMDTKVPGDPANRTHRQIQGGTAADALVEGQLGLFKAQMQYFGDKNNGVAHLQGRINEVQKSDDVGKVLAGPAGQDLRIMQAIGSIAGGSDVEKAFITRMVLGDGMPKRLADTVSTTILKAIAPPDPTQPEPLKKAVDNLRKIIDPDNTGSGNNTQAFQRFFEHVDSIAKMDIKPESPNYKYKVALAEAIVHPENAELIRGIKEGYTTSSGNYIPGNEAIFNILSSESMAKMYKQMDATTRPGIFDRWTNWVKTTADVDLYKQDIRTLNTLPLRQEEQPTGIAAGINLGDSRVPYQMSYDPVNHRFGVDIMGKDGKVLRKDINLSPQYGATAQGSIATLNRTVNRMNDYANGIKNIAKVDPSTDVNQYILQSLVNAGADPERVSTIRGIPEAMVRAMLATSKARQKAIEDRQKALDKLGGE